MAKKIRLRRADFCRRELGGEMIIYSQKLWSISKLFFFYMSHVDFHVDSHVDFHVDSEIRKKKVWFLPRGIIHQLIHSIFQHQMIIGFYQRYKFTHILDTKK